LDNILPEPIFKAVVELGFGSWLKRTTILALNAPLFPLNLEWFKIVNSNCNEKFPT
jgi:hypothetical protein